jgi:hypothetical protein
MKGIREIAVASLALLVLCGCASRYIISTTDGTMIQVDGEPKYNKNTDMYEYTDLAGNSASIKHADVKQILKQ